MKVVDLPINTCPEWFYHGTIHIFDQMNILLLLHLCCCGYVLHSLHVLIDILFYLNKYVHFIVDTSYRYIIPTMYYSMMPICIVLSIPNTVDILCTVGPVVQRASDASYLEGIGYGKSKL